MREHFVPGFLLAAALLASQANAASIIVGTNRPIKTIADGIDASLPLLEDLVVYVEEPSLVYSKPQSISAKPEWNSHKVIVRGVKAAPSSTIFFGDDAVYEFDGTSMTLAYENINVPGSIEGRLVGADPFYYVKDQSGSTRMTLDKQGAIIEAQWYQSMGGFTGLVSGTNPTREKFTGKELDQDGAEGAKPGINLDYFGTRYYDTDLGMWTSPDPVRQFASAYSYGANPLNGSDPDGTTYYANLDGTYSFVDDGSKEVIAAGFGYHLGEVGKDLEATAMYEFIASKAEKFFASQEFHGAEGLLKFRNLVTDGARFDIKTNPNSLFWEGFGTQFHIGTDKMEAQDVGNMLFGRYGHAAQYSLGVLRFGAGLNQVSKWSNIKEGNFQFSIYMDDVRDEKFVMKGFSSCKSCK